MILNLREWMRTSRGERRKWSWVEGGVSPTFRGWVNQEWPGWGTEKERNLREWDGRSLRKRAFQGGGSGPRQKAAETSGKTWAQSLESLLLGRCWCPW